MIIVLLYTLVIIASASSHNGRCPVHEDGQWNANGEKVVIVEEVVPSNRFQHRIFGQRIQQFGPPIQTGVINVNTVPAGFGNIVDPGKQFIGGRTVHSTIVESDPQVIGVKSSANIVESIPQVTAVKTVHTNIADGGHHITIPVNTIPVHTKTFVTGSLVDKNEVTAVKTVHTNTVDNSHHITIPVNTIPVHTKTIVTGSLVDKNDQPIAKPVPIPDNKVIVEERNEQFPSVKTIPVDVKSFVTGQKSLVTKEVDVPVESTAFEVPQRIVKVVHISKEKILPESDEAIHLNLASGADKLFKGQKIDISFSCHGKTYGYYADVRNLCKIYHICRESKLADGSIWTQKSSFTCPAGTIFDQQKLGCVDVGSAMDCAQSELLYEKTAQIFSPPVEKKFILKEAEPPIAPVKSCCVYPSCAYVFPCAM